MVHDAAMVTKCVYQGHHEMQQGELRDGQAYLARCAQQCTKNKPSLRYVDSPYIVELCKQRRLVPKGPARKLA